MQLSAHEPQCRPPHAGSAGVLPSDDIEESLEDIEEELMLVIDIVGEDRPKRRRRVAAIFSDSASVKHRLVH